MAADPYLAVTLDAKRRIAQVARALDQPHPGPAAWGLLELLEDVWRRKDPAVSALVLAACFGPDPRWPAALEAFGFLAPALPTDGSGWVLHPTEADRLLLTHAKRVAAGKARAGGAKRSAHGRLQRSTSTSPAPDQHVTSTPPAADQLLQPAASSQQPAAGEEEDLAGGSARGKSPTSAPENTAARQLREAWNALVPAPIARWQEGSGRNKAAADALKRRPLEQWLVVFRRLGASTRLREGFGEGNWRANPDWAIRKAGAKPEPAQQLLEGHWDDGPAARGAPKAVDVRKGTVRAEDQDHLHGPAGPHEF